MVRHAVLELPADSPPRYIGMFISRLFIEKHDGLCSRKKPEVFHGTFFEPAEGFSYQLKRFMIEADKLVCHPRKTLPGIAFL